MSKRTKRYPGSNSHRVINIVLLYSYTCSDVLFEVNRSNIGQIEVTTVMLLISIQQLLYQTATDPLFNHVTPQDLHLGVTTQLSVFLDAEQVGGFRSLKRSLYSIVCGFQVRMAGLTGTSNQVVAEEFPTAKLE